MSIPPADETRPILIDGFTQQRLLLESLCVAFLHLSRSSLPRLRWNRERVECRRLLWQCRRARYGRGAEMAFDLDWAEDLLTAFFAEQIALPRAARR